MEIAKINEKSLRIKSKNTSFIVNPEKKVDEEIVILTEPPADYSNFQDKIVISGPGEYEIGGVSIKSEAGGGGISFDFFEEGQRLVVLSSAALATSKDTEDAAAVVVFVDGSTDKLAQITADVVAVIGPESILPADRTNIKKVDKINLKKTEEYKGFIVYLSK